jgi:hypothetical protein
MALSHLICFKAHLLQVEDDVGDIFSYPLDGREFVLHAVNLHGRNGQSTEGRQEHAAKGIPNRDAVSTLERSDHKLTGLLGLFPSLTTVGLSAAAALPAVLGVAAGQRLRERVSARTRSRGVLALLVVIGSRLLLGGLGIV